MNNRYGLPPRPSFSATPQAGPSQPRPPAQNQRKGRPQQNQQQQQYQQYQAVPSPSLSYNPYANQASYTGGYPQHGLPQPPSYGMMGSSGGYQQPNISGGYPSFFPSQPTYPQYSQNPQYSNQLSAQALFHQPPQPQANSGGYSYSSTYAQSQPPAKRQRPDSNSQTSAVIESSGVGPGSGSGSGSGSGIGSGSIGTWRNCSHPGCKFVGPSEKVQIHEEDRHLIFVNGKMPERSEEEERFARRKGPPPPIQGTNITLNTPEEIEKWIAERKAKWPSAKRVQEKEEERTAAIARGEIPARGKRKKMDAASLAEEWGRPVNVDHQFGGERTRRGRGRGIDIDRGSRGRGRGRGRGGHIGHTTTETGDQAWSQITTLPSIKPKSSPSSVKPSINALSALEGYDTPTSSSKSIDSSSDAKSDSASSSGSSTTSSESSSENDSSEDELISKDEDKACSIKGEGKAPVSVKGQKEICKFFKRNGNCKFGNKCRNSHMIDEDAKSINARDNPHFRQPQIQSTNSKKQNHFARPSMLGSLLSNPIQNTISQLSQTIRFLVANNMLEGVELNPGDAQAQDDEKNKITEVEERT
ncbi:hypothetical protein V865_003644 [Kwoniella europaea PYCC6329]|uniref:C3H1-type domain-containing protein n=1 Tax=Kwoniella europaea PYCC6329 TaxID=1423913 RepID=A0AAX4KHR3_9TREE